jgi:hypothetical protein
MIKHSFILLAVLFFLAVLNTCKDNGTNPENTEFVLPDSNLTYLDHIRPMFVAKCASRSGCHSNTDLAGGLDLTDYQAIRLHWVNVTTPLVIDGDGANSYLYRVLLPTDIGTPRMPLDGPYLNNNNTNGIKVWIDEGLN